MGGNTAMGYQWDTNGIPSGPSEARNFTIFTTSSFKKKNRFSPRSMLNIHPGTALFFGFLPGIFEDRNYAIPFVQGWVEKVAFPRGSVNSFTLPLWNKCSFHAINSAIQPIQPPKKMRFKSLLSIVIENQYPLATSDFLKTTTFIGTSSTSKSQQKPTKWIPLSQKVRVDFPNKNPTRVQRVGSLERGDVPKPLTPPSWTSRPGRIGSTGKTSKKKLGGL